MSTITKPLLLVCAWVRKLGPYVALEIVLPGGTLFAVLLFLYRRRKVALPLPAAFD